MMTSFQQKLERLLQRLELGTSDGSIEWTLVDGEKARAKTSAGNVIISPSKDSSGQVAVAISLIGSGAGKSLTFDDTDLYYQDELGNRVHFYSRMNDLLESAIRNAKGEEGLVNSFLDALSDDIPF